MSKPLHVLSVNVYINEGDKSEFAAMSYQYPDLLGGAKPLQKHYKKFCEKLKVLEGENDRQ